MDENQHELEAAVRTLAERLALVETRLTALEGEKGRGPATPPAPTPVSDPSAESLPTFPGRGALAAALSAAGRTFLVLGGAYLLRALTDTGIVPAAGGVALGLLYGAVWIGLASRAGARGGSQSAGFHAVAAALIAYPLLWEATTRFGALSPPSSAGVLVLFTALALLVAWHRQLEFVAWVFTLGAVGTGTILLFATGAPVLFAATLLLLGGATVWLGHLRPWPGIRWIPAIVANLAVLRLSLLASPRFPVEGSPAASAASAVALGLVAVYLGSFAIQTLARRRDVGVFEVVQSLAALVVGLGGAARMAHFVGSDGTFLGVVAWIVAGACYAVAFAFVRRHLGRGRNFFFYTSLALALLLFGGQVTDRSELTTSVWILGAIAAAALGGRYDRVTLRAHSAILLAAAAWQGRLFAFAATSFLAPVEPAWTAPAPLTIAVLLAGALSYAALVVTRRFREAPRLARIPRFVIALVSVLGLGSLAVFLGARALAGGEGPADGAQIAAVRTAVLAVGAILLAVARARTGWKELTWIVTLLLVAGGAKLVLEDLRSGHPLTLFLSFACYGAALLTAPRLLRSSRSAS